MASLEQSRSLSLFATCSEHDGGGTETVRVTPRRSHMPPNEFAQVKAQVVLNRTARWCKSSSEHVCKKSNFDAMKFPLKFKNYRS